MRLIYKIPNLESMLYGKVEAKVKEALIDVGLKMVQDIEGLDPRPPYDTGNLRGSWSVYVGHSKVMEGASSPGSVPDIASDLSVTVSFDTPYTQRQDKPAKDGSVRYKHHKKPDANLDSGRGFMSKKTSDRAHIYREMIQRRLNP